MRTNRFFLLATFCMVCFAATAAHARRYDRHVVVINDSSRVVVEFHASNEHRRGWEEDILGTGVILPGHRARIDIDDGTGACVFDFKAVMRDGATVIRRSVDVCALNSWTITD